MLGVFLGWTLQLVAVNPADAQSLQNSSGGLQPQQNQTQNSFNTQPQTGGLQNNGGGGQSLLNQGGAQPLGVVSGPGQSAPGNVTQPSQNLRAGTNDPAASEPAGRNKAPIIIAVLFIALAVGFYIFMMFTRSRLPAGDELKEEYAPVAVSTSSSISAASTSADPASAADSALASKPAEQAQKKKVKRAKKRKKPHQR